MMTLKQMNQLVNHNSERFSSLKSFVQLTKKLATRLVTKKRTLYDMVVKNLVTKEYTKT